MNSKTTIKTQASPTTQDSISLKLNNDTEVIFTSPNMTRATDKNNGHISAVTGNQTLLFSYPSSASDGHQTFHYPFTGAKSKNDLAWTFIIDSTVYQADKGTLELTLENVRNTARGSITFSTKDGDVVSATFDLVNTYQSEGHVSTQLNNGQAYNLSKVGLFIVGQNTTFITALSEKNDYHQIALTYPARLTNGTHSLVYPENYESLVSGWNYTDENGVRHIANSGRFNITIASNPNSIKGDYTFSTEKEDKISGTFDLHAV